MIRRDPLRTPTRDRLVIAAVALVLVVVTTVLIRAETSPRAAGSRGGGGIVPGAAASPAASSAAISSVGPSEAAGTPGMTPLGSPPVFPSRVVTLHVPILTWHVIAPHSVAASYAQPSLDVDPETFRAQLQLLHDRGWHTITMEALARLLADGIQAPPKTFVITIDDGYEDGFTYALPILQADGFVATYYVVPGRVGDRHKLTWDQVATLAADGMEIGNHTMHHRPLNLLPGSAARDEVVQAEDALTAHLGVAPATFAYPFGGFDPALEREVAAAGLWIAATTRWGTSETWANRMAIPRVHVSPTENGATILGICESFR